MIIENLKALLTLDSKSFTAGMQKASKDLSTVSKAARNFNAVLAFEVGRQIASTVFDIAKMSAEVEGLKRSLQFATGEASLEGKTFHFLRKETDRLGVSMESSIGQFKGMAAAARGTRLEGEGVREIYTAIAEAATVMGLDSERLKLSLLGVQQMMSKGTIQAQELRLQLGESMPMAINVMAKSLDMSVQEMNKLMEKGQLMSEDVLPKFAKAMREEFAGGVDQASKSLQASIGRMQNAWFDFKSEMTKGGTAQALQSLVEVTTDVVNILGKLSYVLTASINNFKLYKDSITAAASATWDFFRSLEKLGPTTGALGILPSISPSEGDSFGSPSDAYNEELQKMGSASQAYADEVIKQRQEMSDELDKNTAQSLDRQAKTLEAYIEMSTDYLEDSLNDLADAVVDMSMGIEVNFDDLIKSILADLQRLVLQILVIEPILAKFRDLLQGIQGGGGGGILGGIFGGLGKVFKMASGGIINEPVIGLGAKTGSGYMMGEKGPEAVVPVGKGANSSSGGGSKVVNVNINAVDSKSVIDLMQNNPQAVLSPIIQALQLGDRGLSSAMRSAL